MENNIDKQIYVRMAEPVATAGGKTLRIALVSEITDSYETVLHPGGCVTPLRGGLVDIRHNRVPTECQMSDIGIEKVEVPTGNTNSQGQPEMKEIKARIVDIFVPENARQWTKQNEHLRAEQVPSLYDDIKNWPNNRFRWGSVDFKPLETVQYRDVNGKLVREEYPKWRLNFFSLLDQKPGQDTSYVLSVRSDQTKNQPMSKFKKGDELSRQVKAKITSDSTEKDGKKLYNVRIDDGDETEIDEDELTRLFGKPAEKPAAKTEGEDKEFDEETVKPNKKTVADENEKVRALEEKIEVLTNTVAELSEKQTKRSGSDSKTDNDKEAEAKIAELETQLRLYKEKEAAAGSITDLKQKGSDSANIRQGVDQSESATEPAPKPAYNDLLRKYATPN